MPKLQEKPSALKREHPAIQNMKFFLWVIFALLDPEPDPAFQINADPDPDPQPWLKKKPKLYTGIYISKPLYAVFRIRNKTSRIRHTGYPVFIHSEASVKHFQAKREASKPSKENIRGTSKKT